MQRFDSSRWIAASIPEISRLQPETKAILAEFVQVWNLFEDLVCDRRAAIDLFFRIVDSHNDEIHSEPLGRLNEAFSFWKERYFIGQKPNEVFQGLSFRNHDRKEEVMAIFNREGEVCAKDLMRATGAISIRLRNNLFHGIKSYSMLDGQVENLNAACHCLAIFVELFRLRNRFPRVPVANTASRDMQGRLDGLPN